MTGWRDERGVASLVAVAGVAVLLVLFAGVVAVTDLVLTGSRAATAADQAALAGANAAALGTGQACRRASAIAAANGAGLTSCRLGSGVDDPFTIDVVVAVPVTGPLRVIAPALGLPAPVVRARARAGPATAR